MAVTSDELLKFVRECVTENMTLDADGAIVHVSRARLEGEPLAKALESIGNLAAHEEGLAFAKSQHDIREASNVLNFPGPRAN